MGAPAQSANPRGPAGDTLEPMRVVFAGTPDVAAVSLTALLESSTHDVVAVLTRPAAERGRGRRRGRSPVAELAAEREIPVLSPASPRDPEFLAELRAIEPDCCPVVAYGGLIGKDALAIPRFGWVNLHFSVLPAWRGAAPVQWSVISGDDVTGASTFALVPELDAGPVYGTLTEPIGPRDTAGDLLARLTAAGSRLLTDTLDGIEAGALTARPQPADGVTLAPKLSVDDAEIDWASSARVVDRRIRGMSPTPGAWTRFRGERLKVLRSHLAEADPASNPASSQSPTATTPGELTVTKRRVTVRCGDPAPADPADTRAGGGVEVELDSVQPAGKPAMAAADWARGVRPAPGERLS